MLLCRFVALKDLKTADAIMLLCRFVALKDLVLALLLPLMHVGTTTSWLFKKCQETSCSPSRYTFTHHTCAVTLLVRYVAS